MKKNNIVITSAWRTAVGSLGKSLKNIKSHELGAKIISETLERSNLSKEDIDEIILGQVLTGGAGQNPPDKLLSMLGFQKKSLHISLIKCADQV